MAATENLLPYGTLDDDYIDMEISSYLANFNTSGSITVNSPPNPPPNPREFEFHMSSTLVPEKEASTTSPADELFYKGKLLPLHLPPRLQMVEKLLENHQPNPSSHYFDYDIKFREKSESDQDFFSTPLMTNTLNTPAATANCTPFESCNISPVESCQVSRELNPNEYFLEYANEESEINGEMTKKSWTKKLKIGSKLRASRSYFLKALFGKSGCSDESSKVADEGVINISKAKQYCPNNNNNNTKKININDTNNNNKSPFGQIQKGRHETERFVQKEKKKTGNGEDDRGCHRRSFSMVIKRNSTNKKSSPSTMPCEVDKSNKNNNKKLLLKRCSSSAYNPPPSSEIENSIQGAIAHCKQSSSQMMVASHTRSTTVSEVGFHSLTSFSEDQEKENLCRV